MDFKQPPAHISTVQWRPSCIGDTSILVGEIEPKLHLTQWNQKSNLATHVMLDFMSTIRLMAWTLGNFPDMGAAIYTPSSRQPHAFPTYAISFILYLTSTSRCH